MSATDMADVSLPVDPALPAFIADPGPWYALLRREAPVHFVAAEGMWWITRYADVVRVLGDARIGKEWPRDDPDGGPGNVGGEDEPPGGAAAAEAAEASGQAGHAEMPDPYARRRDLPAHMLDRDPPAHTRMRSLVAGAFTPRVVERLRPRIEAIARELLEETAGGRQLDLVDAFAFPLSAIVIAELLGVPAEDRSRFRRWSQDIVRGLGPESGGAGEASMAANVALLDDFTELCAERRVDPRQDLISEMLAIEAQGDRLSAGEVLSTCILLLIAGHETTASLIGTGTLTLLRHPAAWARLAREPPLLPAAVEELLRYRVAGAALLPRAPDRRGGRRGAHSAPRGHPAGLRRRQPRSGRLRRSRTPGAGPRAQPPPRVRPRDPFLPRRSAGAPGGGRGLRRAAAPRAASATRRRP